MASSVDTVPAGVTQPPAVTCLRARTPEAVEAHRAIRHLVFVVEQALFDGTDADAHDRDGSAIGIIGYSDHEAAGTVRLFELDRHTGLWQGDRLAVLPRFRTLGVGAPLVRCATATAGALGGREMVAHIQLPNVRFFSRLGWRPEGETEIYAGRPHQRMRIALPDPGRGAELVEQLARRPGR